MRVKCQECGAVHVLERKGEKQVTVRAVVSRSGVSFKRTVKLPRDEEIRVGEEILIERDDSTVSQVEVTSLEARDGRRLDNLTAGEVGTLWCRDIEEVKVKFSVNLGRTTQSLEKHLPGEQEITVGETLDLEGENCRVVKIKIRRQGFLDRKGEKTAARHIQRVYAIPVGKKKSR